MTTQDITIWNEAADSSADVDSENRLKVTAITFPGRVEEAVYQYQTYGTSTNQINYTVPTGKVLYIVTMYGNLDIKDGGKITTEWQEDGDGFASMAMYKDANSSVQITAPANVPFGPFTAGTVIRCRRVSGDSGKDWSSGFVGFLEDL